MIEPTDEERAAMREYNEAPDGALEGVPKMFHTAIHYAYRCGRTDADRRSGVLDGERIEGWVGDDYRGLWEFAAESESYPFVPGPTSRRATLTIHLQEPAHD